MSAVKGPGAATHGTAMHGAAARGAARHGRTRQQWVIAGTGGVLLLGVLWTISQLMQVDDPTMARASAQSGVTASMIADRTSAASPEMSWVNLSVERLEAMEAQVEELTRAMTTQREDHARAIAEVEAQADEVLAGYEATIEDLQGRLASGAPAGAGVPGRPAEAAPVAGAGADFLRPASAAGQALARAPLGAGTPPAGRPRRSIWAEGEAPADVTNARAPIVEPAQGGGPVVRSFALGGGAEGAEAPGAAALRVGAYLPAGSYAPATVLSGVDASTGVTSQAEPVPVLFRITAPAVTAGTRSVRGHRIDLTGCTVTGSARGDLSSERVLVRLLKLSCVRAGGIVLERDVSGYMSGQGKAGARGLVVSREGKLVTGAGIAGALGGLAQGTANAGALAGGAGEASFAQALQGAGGAAAAGGVSGAADMLSEYYIERAEQYQPVVSLYGGTAVELVFLEGVDLR